MSYENFELIVTDQDSDRLDVLLNSSGESAQGLLERELDRAHVVPQRTISPNVVTMNSVVTFLDENTNEVSQIALVYPNNANASEGRISVLAPLGSALLGLKAGQQIECPLPNNKSRLIKVLSVDFQPESRGAYDL